MEENGLVAVVTEQQGAATESYADHVVADIEAAKVRVQQAIEHYEMQRREADEFYDNRIKEIDAAVARLRGSLTGSPKPTASDAPVWQRAQAAVAAHGAMTTKRLSVLVGKPQAGVISELRRKSDVFRVFDGDDGQMVALR